MKVTNAANVDGILDWEDLAEVDEDQLMCMAEAGTAEALVKVDDFFGWDYIFRLPDGKLVLSDRNCGFCTNVSEVQLEAVLKVSNEES